MIRTLSILAFVVATPAMSHDIGQHRINLDELDYQNPPGNDRVETSVAWGEVQAEGELYATHARAQDGAYIPPHTHPNTLTTVVTSGTVFVGVGEVYDEDALVGYEAGSFFVTEAGVPHFIFAQDGDFSVLDHGVGPGGITFIEQPEGAPQPGE